MSAGIAKIKRLQKAGKDDLCNRYLRQKLWKIHLREETKTPFDSGISDDFRTRYWDELGESCVRYGLIADTFCVEEGEALDDALYDIYGYAIHSPYDCTGLLFTRYIHGHRNPNGMISVIHGLGRDV